ncbi:hypothetical protein GQ44DRAFT_787043, partial [Phaeosphaeriaceae sp. PMI808]
KGGTIQGALNVPAQSLYPSIPTWYTRFSQAGVKSVIWFCGSSLHRGFRAAVWFYDYIRSMNNTPIKSFVLLRASRGLG